MHLTFGMKVVALISLTQLSRRFAKLRRSIICMALFRYSKLHFLGSLQGVAVPLQEFQNGNSKQKFQGGPWPFLRIKLWFPILKSCPHK